MSVCHGSGFHLHIYQQLFPNLLPSSLRDFSRVSHCYISLAVFITMRLRELMGGGGLLHVNAWGTSL